MRSLLVLAAALSLAAPALAARRPSHAERAVIAQTLGVPGRCLTIKVATVAPGWASARFAGPAGDCVRYASDGVTILRRSDGIWHQRFAGSSYPCPIRGVPETVRRDLKVPCPQQGG